MMNRIIKQKQSGYTLIEFMVAGSLGLLLLLGVTQIYLGASRTNQLQSGVIEVQDMGRFVLSYMEKDLQRAGWSNLEPVIDLNTLDAHIIFSGGVSSDNTGTNSSDAITIQYEADNQAGIDTSYDCAGNAVATDGVITNTYSVTASGLTCNGRVLIPNVESLQVLYGVESQAFDMDNIVDGYLTAAQVAANGYEEMVIAVRLGVLLSSSAEVLDLGNVNTNSYQVLDYTHPAQNDRRLRRVFVKTILLPNRPQAF